MMKDDGKRVWTITLVLIFAAIFLSSAYFYDPPDELEGTVDHKTVTGDLDDVSYTLIQYTPHGLYIDPMISDLIDGNDTNMTITSEIEDELEDMGFTVHYVINIVLDDSDELQGSKSYLTDYADDFNDLPIGGHVSFEEYHGDSPTIGNIHAA